MLPFQLYYSDKQPLYQICFEYLRDMIVCGFICVGEFIREEDYATRLNLSRTPIRTALKKLEVYGLVVSDPSTGSMLVKGLGTEGIDCIYDIQNSLEMLLLPLVARHITLEELTELWSMLANIKNAIKDRNLNTAAKNNAMLHKRMLCISRFPGVRDVIDWAYGLVNGFNLLAFEDESRQCAISSEHSSLVDALQSGDVPLLLRMSSIHTVACRDYSLKRYMENYNYRLSEMKSVVSRN